MYFWHFCINLTCSRIVSCLSTLATAISGGWTCSASATPTGLFCLYLHIHLPLSQNIYSLPNAKGSSFMDMCPFSLFALAKGPIGLPKGTDLSYQKRDLVCQKLCSFC